MSRFASRYTQPLLGAANAAGYLVATTPTSVLIRRNGVATTIYSTRAKAPLANPIVGAGIGVAPGLPGVDTLGNLTLYAEAGDGLDAVVTTAFGSVIVAMPGIATDPAEPLSSLPAGVVGDGVADVTAALQAALNSVPVGGGVVSLPPGLFKISATLTVTVDGTVLRGAGESATTIICAAASNFQDTINLTGRTGVGFEDITIDANQAGRAASLTTVTTGIYGLSLIDCWAARCTVTNVIGTAIPASGNGIALVGDRCLIESCKAIDCGIAGKPADGFFIGSGNKSLIHGCVALNCIDTAFVVESANNSGISDCAAEGCGCVAAVTNAAATTRADNFIDNVTGTDWAAASGGINVAAINAGDLVGTRVSNVTISDGVGPAVSVRPFGAGRVLGLTMANLRVSGATTQGVLVNAEDVLIATPRIEGTTSIPILIQAGSDNVRVLGGHVTATGTPGIDSNGSNNVSIVGTKVDGTPTYGVFFRGTATNCRTLLCEISGMTNSKVGSEAGTNPDVVNAGFGGLEFGEDPLRVLYHDPAFAAYVRLSSGLLLDGSLYHNGTAVGFNQTAPIGKCTLGAAATDATTTQALANLLRQALVDLGLGQT